jgi:spore coat polysaccharide biosynthesis protein SpsF
MIAAIIQARTGSSRLPNKVFKSLCGKPLIWHIVNRLKPSTKINQIILATTRNVNDDLLEQWAIANNIPCFRGSEEDVLERYFKAAAKFAADIIVRITADDPFKEANIIDEVISLFEKENLDFAYNNNPPTFPEGLDVEVFSFNAIENAYYNAKDPFEREHVTQYFYRNPTKFRQKCLAYHEDISHLRWTIDTQEDWEMASIVYDKLFNENKVFSMGQILNLIKEKPEIAEINSTVKRSAMYVKRGDSNA